MRATFASLALVCSAALAQGGSPERAAKTIEICSACHGQDGNAAVSSTPSLAAQPETFLVSQMILFREGLRQVPQMASVFAKTSEQDLLDLAAYFSKQPLKPNPGVRDAALYDKGAALSKRGSCGGCHLADYRGREQIPRLAGQREDYLASTMIAYRDNKRSGTDTTMAGILYGISDPEIRALAHYLAHQR
ncbi:MAG TPA: c-type cytochrome [Burkholderiaceae bacterium]|nr:c-type cytochrome [Burkholderiaceae bacterium]